MAIKLENWSAWQALEDLRRSIQSIDPASGYNLRPNYLLERPVAETISSTAFPAIFVEAIGIDDALTKYGPANSFTEDADLSVVVWGYVEEPGDKEKALLSMALDIFEAIWTDETRTDAAILTNLEGVEFVEGVKENENLGIVVVALSIPFSTNRGVG